MTVRAEAAIPSTSPALAGLIERYRALPGVYDEMIDADGAIRPHWRPFLDALARLGPDEVKRRFGVADQHLRESGVVFQAYGDNTGTERAWPLSHVPLLIAPADWAALTQGLEQRAELIDRLLGDIYGGAKLVREGRLPAAVVAGSADFLRPLAGVEPRGGSHITYYAADVARAPDGTWWVLGDRTQAPSGAGYALENRLAMARALPETYRAFSVERLAGFFQGFRAQLSGLAEHPGARTVMLTPGPLNETYFEHAYLARYLGFLLVEGEDLTVRDGRVYIRTVSGLHRAEVIWRRLDGDFADPIELNGRSQLGVPGLVQAVRAGHVAVVNALGAGLAESRALMSFLPGLFPHLLGQPALLPHVATWWCGQRAEREAVLAHLGDFAVAPAFTATLPGVLAKGAVAMGDLDKEKRAELERMICQRGADIVAQEVVKLSTMPVWREGALEPRPFILRVFLAKIAGRWTAMPGGFCRITDKVDARAVTMQRGGRSADVWVLSDGPVKPVTLLPSPEHVEIRRHTGTLPSRVADNLFWLARYLERGEATLRLLRTLGPASGDVGDGGARSRAVVDMLKGAGALPPDPLLPSPLFLAGTALHRADLPGAMPSLVNAARRAASIIRDRLSPDAWRVINDLVQLICDSPAGFSTETEAFDKVDQALRILAAFSGLAQENMNRLSGWRFLELGRRLERAIGICRFAARMSDESLGIGGLDLLLDLADSQITYRRRYVMAPAREPVLDLVLLDDNNPRSLAFQLARMARHLSVLPSAATSTMFAGAASRIASLETEWREMHPEDITPERLFSVESEMRAISEEISARYFIHLRPHAPEEGR